MVNKNHIFFFVTSLILVIDRLTKFLSTSITFNSDFFSINIVKNQGVGFGLFQGQYYFILFVSLIVLGVIIYYYNSIPNSYVNIAIALILGGTLGNLYDRLAYGYVIDFLDFKVWPVFNIADTALVIGTILLIIYFWD
tara:strand:+ start:253 stop:666 length:414 start_codon:yes stop_codon:yes gene_type:complete